MKGQEVIYKNVIDWTKPVYDADGGEVFALRRPDGTVFRYAQGAVRVITSEGQDLGCWSPAGALREFSAARPPVRDWECAMHARAEGVPGDFLIRYGTRNGKPFAEVVE